MKLHELNLQKVLVKYVTVSVVVSVLVTVKLLVKVIKDKTHVLAAVFVLASKVVKLHYSVVYQNAASQTLTVKSLLL